jgi:hypothetical protein
VARTWEDNADEFRELDAGEGWPFAALVACSVQRGAGQSERGSRHATRNDEKVSGQVFAERAGVSAGRVLRYLDGWNVAAEQGLVRPSDELRPEDYETVEYPKDPEHSWMVRGERNWTSRYAPNNGLSRQPDDAVHIIERRGVEAVLAAMPQEQVAELVTRAVQTRPEVLDTALANPDVFVEVVKGQERELDRRRFNAQARVVASGGRIPAIGEVNEPQPPSRVDTLFAQTDLIDRARRLMQQAAEVVREARALAPLTEAHQAEVRRWSLMLLDAMETEEVAR